MFRFGLASWFGLCESSSLWYQHLECSVLVQLMPQSDQPTGKMLQTCCVLGVLALRAGFWQLVLRSLGIQMATIQGSPKAMHAEPNAFLEMFGAFADTGAVPDVDEIADDGRELPADLIESSVRPEETEELATLFPQGPDEGATSSSGLGFGGGVAERVPASSSGAASSSDTPPSCAEGAADADFMAGVTWDKAGAGPGEGIVLRGATPLGKLTPFKGRRNVSIVCKLHYGCRLLVSGKCSDLECVRWLARGKPLPQFATRAEHDAASEVHKARPRPKPGV